MVNINRRRFVSGMTALSMGTATGLLSSLASSRAMAASTTGYKALVFVELNGGMDHADTILPMDPLEHAELVRHRDSLLSQYGAGNGSRGLDQLLPLTGNGVPRPFGVPQELAGIRELFDAGELAIVGNVGTLVQPTTRSQMAADVSQMPPRLFSHNDQLSFWQTMGAEGTPNGWGGKFLDASMGPTNVPFSALSVAGMNSYLTGDKAYPFIMRPEGIPPIAITEPGYVYHQAPRHAETVALLNEHFASAGVSASNVLVQDIANMNGRAYDQNGSFRQLWEGRQDLSSYFSDSLFAARLRAVAEIIGMQSSLGLSRQIFFVRLHGFDTHSNQASRISELHTDLGSGLKAFATALKSLGLYDDVTLFTASDFGRSVISNGTGTDHGWGGHHFVMGGSVAGGRIYGDIPPPDLGLEMYTSEKGRLIPTTSTEQYAATMGSWFGLSASELNSIFPNLSNFSANNLGFL